MQGVSEIRLHAGIPEQAGAVTLGGASEGCGEHRFFLYYILQQILAG